MRQSAGNSWPFLTLIIAPGEHSAQQMGTYFFYLLETYRTSISLLLMLCVTARYLISNTMFLMLIKTIFTDSAIIGKLMLIMSNELSVMRANNNKLSRFSRCQVLSMIKYHTPSMPWYLFANILFVFYT
jgi:hypothetical protein